jgi:hypothetical protein
VALFKPADPKKKAEAALESAIATRDGLTEKRKVAESAIAEHRERARQLAREGADDAELTAAETAMRAQQDRASTLTAAIGDVEKDIAALSTEIERIVDQKMRSETAATVGAMTRELEDAQREFDSAAKRLEDATRAVAPLVLDGHPITAFVMSARQQLPPAIDVLVVGLKAHAAAVIAGSARASLPAPDVAPPKLKIVAPSTRVVFALKHVAFVDRDGVLQRRPRCHDVELPIPLADEAIRVKAACEMTDPRRKQLYGTFGAVTPDLANCVKLGDVPVADDAPKSNAPPIMSSSTVFEPHPNIGKPFTKIVATTLVEPLAAGARALSPDEGEP